MASVNRQGGDARARHRRPGDLRMSEFGEVWDASGLAPLTRVTYVQRESFNWLVPDTHLTANQTETLLGGLIVEETDLQQASLYALNLLCIAYPTLDHVMTPIVERMGINLNKIKIPSEAYANFLPLPTIILSPRQLSVIHVSVFILVFKNVTSVNYDNFMYRRIAALKAIVGIAETDSTGLRIMTLEKVQNFKATIGNNPSIRKEIVERILPYATLWADADASALRYAARICQWADMTVITFIVDGLLRPNSPALRHPGVLGEVINLKDALIAISSCQFPQFFRSIARPHERYLVERNRFPVLACVAWEIRKLEYPSLTQFVGATAATGGALVNELLAIHRSYVAQNQLMRAVRAVDFLTDLERREMREAVENF